MISTNSDTTFEPYTNGASPNPDYPQDIRVVTGDNQVVVQNKNLCPSAFQNNINILGSGNNRIVEAYAYKKCQVIKVKPNTTYTLSGTFTTSFGDNIGRVCMFDEYPIVDSVSTKVVTGNPNLTFTTDTNTHYIALLSAKANTNIEAPDLQLEYGSTATSYVTHQEQTYTLHLGTEYLAGIGDYIDLPFKDGDTWKIRRNIGKVDLSTLNWNINSHNVSGYKRYSTTEIENIKYVSSNTQVGDGLAEKYVLTMGSGISYKINVLAIDVSQVSVCDKSGHYPTGLFYYALATPVEETITDTTLINDLNNLQDMLSYNGTTNITVISEDTNAQMEVEVTYTSESDMCEKLLFIFNKMKDKLYHIIRSL